MTDLELAIQNLRANTARYDKPERYYRGDHDLSFATEKFENAFGSLFREFALNLCPAIVDAVRDKLKITGFSLGPQAPLPASVVPDADNTTANNNSTLESRPTKTLLPFLPISPSPALPTSPSTIHAALDSIWFANRLDLTAEEIHLEALKLGDAYAIVWPDSNGGVTIYPQRAANCTVIYGDEIPGQMRFAAKYWRASGGRVRLNLLYPDRIEKYISRNKSDLSLPDLREFLPVGDRSGFVSDYLSGDRDAGESSTVPNPYGMIPLFHFSNTCEIGTFGKSELTQAIPIQNGLNKSVLDMLVAMEFSAFRQRWVTGIEVEYDPNTGEAIPPFKVGCDRLWTATNPQVNFGDFNTTDLDQFLKVKDSFRVDMASVTGTPLHYFLQNIRGFASGEALGRSEARFLAKVRDRQRAFGQTWAACLSFALHVAGLAPGILLRPQWEDPAPMAQREFLENLILKKKLGISTQQALQEAGYAPTDISQMLNSPESAPPATHMPKPARKQGRSQNSAESVPPAVAGGEVEPASVRSPHVSKGSSKPKRASNLPTPATNMPKPARKQGRSRASPIQNRPR
jgi:hypothetical protein